MGLQKRLYRMFIVFLIIIIVKLCLSMLNNIINNKNPVFKAKDLNLTMESSYFKSFRSSLQSYAFWVTLCTE